MKKQFKQFILGVVLISTAITTGFSQEKEIEVKSDLTDMHLTLKEAQEYAVKNNRTVWNAGLSVSEAQKKTWEAISAGLPQVNATVDYQNMMGFKMEFAGMSIALEPTSNFQASVQQLLFSGSYWVGIRMSKIGEEMTETARLQAELDVRQQTQQAYHAVLIAEENRKILEQNLANIQTLAKSTDDMVRVGVAEQTDADQLKVQVAMVMNGIKTVERHTELAYNLLRFQLGVETNTIITLTQTLDELIAEKDAQQTLSAAFDVESNYNVQLLDHQIDLAGKQITLERAAALPTVAAFYSYTHKIKASSFDMAPNNVIGLNASIPIFASGQRHARTQQAKIKLETAQNNRALVTDQLLMQEKQLRFNLSNAVESFDLQREALNVSQRVFESITRKFQQGTVSSLDVTTANTSLLQAQTNYINALMEVFTAQTELEKLLNTL